MEREAVIAKYIEYVLENGHLPASVFAFAKANDFGEREFFEKFASFEALESAFWQQTITETLAAVESGAEWNSFTAQQKLLTFYYAYCDRILDNRSFFLAKFPRVRDGKMLSSSLNGLRHSFIEFAESIIDQGVASGEIANRGPLARTYPQGMFGHFLTVVEFNLADDSNRFERTDAYIEKSAKLAFDVIGTKALDSAFDLVRFLSGRGRTAGVTHPHQNHDHSENPDHADENAPH